MDKLKVEYAYPILTCEEAAVFEEQLFKGDEEAIWKAMSRVGVALGDAILRNFGEVGPLPEKPCVLILAGKGHNAGDAFLAGVEILKQYSEAAFVVLFAMGKEDMKPLVKKALQVFQAQTKIREVASVDALEGSFDIAIDGLLGMSFKPPVREPLKAVIAGVNAYDGIKFRAAVDLPSGLGDAVVFRADFTYATGVAKEPIFGEACRESVGRVKFLDIGFFEKEYTGAHAAGSYLLQRKILEPLHALRGVETHKRNYGHLFVLSGSRSYPGALMMSVQAALKSGVGLLTVCAPESLVPAFAAEVPEAMWVPWPETETGALALKGKPLLLEKLDHGTALLMGPGMGDDPEVQQLVLELVAGVEVPLALDASALVSGIADAVKKRPSGYPGVVVTPHAGEYKRIAGDADLLEWSREQGITTLLKGSFSRIAHEGTLYISAFGGPVLARGGSGDVLSGLLGGLLAQSDGNCLEALSRAVVWQGMTADIMAEEHGQVAVKTTDLLDYLGRALRN